MIFPEYQSLNQKNHLVMTIFTRIIRGEIPCFKVAENDRFFAFLDINPVSIGHTLVVPKVETDYLFDLPDDALTEMVLFSRKVARAIDRATGCLRTGVIVQGLEVPHAHIHLIPLYSENQTMALGYKVEVSNEEMTRIAAAIAARMEY